ncbi:MAG: hypothetical protein IT428_33085 [Planctomycetaceae bacterium]|nr:hypothetical protein [Planctomycetaceae bacterium]
MTISFRTVDDRDPSGPPREITFDEIWQGERWRLQRSVTASGKTGLERTEAFDGKTHYLLTTADRKGMMVEERRFPADGWISIFGSTRGAWGVLEPASQRLETEWMASMGTPGKRLLAVRWVQGNVAHEMHLDPTVDYQPRWWRVVRKPDSADSPVQSITRTVTFEEYVASREFWFVSKGKQAVETVLKDGKTIARVVAFDVMQVEANSEVAGAEFRIDYPKGTQFFFGERERFSKKQ